MDAAKASDRLLVCAPHIVLSPTYQEMHRRVQAGEVGPLYLGRARYGWSGPWWGQWFYQPGGGSLFDLGVYNLTSPVRVLRARCSGSPPWSASPSPSARPRAR